MKTLSVSSTSVLPWLMIRGVSRNGRPAMARLRRGASPRTAQLAGGCCGPTLTRVNEVPAGMSFSSPWLRASFQVFDWQSVNR
jgi:hypothetical protein